MSTLQSLNNSQIYEKQAEKMCIFGLDLKACKVLDDVTSDGRLFHVIAVATGNAQSPIIQSCVGGQVEDE